jgi:outer membrane protein OmpA-like peptidoglycan-associated protein
MRNAGMPIVLALLIAGCSGHNASSSSPAPSPPATATPATVAQTSAASPGASESAASPSPTASPTPDPNLLSPANGTILRSYPAVYGNDANVRNVAESPPGLPDGSKGPFVYVFELPGPATFSSFSAELNGEEKDFPVVTFAVSSTGPDGGFQDVGTITGSSETATKTVASSATGRWVRVTALNKPFASIVALGTLAPLPAGVHASGTYIEEDSPFANGAFVPAGIKPDHWFARFTPVGASLTAVSCDADRYGDTTIGTTNGRFWTAMDGTQPYRGAVNDDGSIVTILSSGGSASYYVRAKDAPKYCNPLSAGSGPRQILALESPSEYALWPTGKDDPPEGYTFSSIAPGMLDASQLAGKDAVMSKLVCNMALYASSDQMALLTQWVAAGHKLLLYTADVCGDGSNFSWLPYPFTSANPGAKGAHGDRLIQVENDALGTADKNDAAHFFDPKTYASDESNQLGDADTVKTQDAHWCGHLFGTNALGVNGFEQMYAVYGKGLIVYDAFDHDDGSRPGYQRVRLLELGLAVPSDLPCSQNVALAFLIQPSQEATFTAGTATTLHASMETLANQGWKGHVAMKTGGDFQATVEPSAFDIAGGTQALSVTVTIPATAKPGAYTVNVIGDGGNGQTAQAAITITGTAPLKKEIIKKHQRIRIYGIHFDYDSAHIQPHSEPVIADIASLLRANPTWRFEVSGHTDSDGGAAYNLGLSQRRAQAVVNDLVARYHIARGRLVAKGYGLTRPVAPNTTPANKALNRRVELERLQ